MKFPIAILKSNESPIYVFNENEFGLVSKGGESFYKRGVVYDSEGIKFLLDGITFIKKAPTLMSLKYFQQMYKVSVNSIPGEGVTLVEFKKIIIDHINLFNKYWIKKDLIKSLEDSINGKNNFSEIIKYLK